MFNKELAGKEITVSEDIIPSGKISFDEFGNAEGKISKEAEEQLLTIPGFQSGKSDAKESLLAPKVKPEVKSVDNEEVEKLTSELEEAHKKNEDLTKELAEVKEKLKLAEAKAKASGEKSNKPSGK